MTRRTSPQVRTTDINGSSTRMTALDSTQCKRCDAMQREQQPRWTRRRMSRAARHDRAQRTRMPCASARQQETKAGNIGPTCGSTRAGATAASAGAYAACQCSSVAQLGQGQWLGRLVQRPARDEPAQAQQWRRSRLGSPRWRPTAAAAVLGRGSDRDQHWLWLNYVMCTLFKAIAKHGFVDPITDLT